MIRLNNDWQFTEEWSKAFLAGRAEVEDVRLPHTVKILPLHYADSDAYQMICGYRKKLYIKNEWKGQRIILQFDGAAHIATLFVNGENIYTHKCGYTSFRVDITDYVEYGEDNLIAVKLDTTENSTVPPFGFVIDYLTYGGIYRDVWLDIRPNNYIDDIYVATVNYKILDINLHCNEVLADSTYRIYIKDADGNIVADKNAPGDWTKLQIKVSDVILWDIDNPYLYTCTAELISKDDIVVDSKTVQFGIRTIRFDNNSFYLNDKKVFIRGLNRHQSYPYVGYAVPEKLQREDARILKEELQVNSVRTSHYPQSHYFLDECDKLGILVFTEIPGWQHVGNKHWIDQACINTEEMVKQYRQHPSIYMWGVRINESLDDDDFYKRTNSIAHELDPYRPTSGVRYLENSSLLEDVYSLNDFSHDGTTKGAKSKKDVMKDVDKPLIISEANGHMFPTKSFDNMEKQLEHTLRHARVLDCAISDNEHAGCYQWCMFDYATHKDFGSGDRICYHGVMDSFRNPKLAAALYASQGDSTPVLAVGTSMDIGDYPAGQIGKIYCFTNADYIKLYKNGDYVSTFKTEGWNGLPHGPVEINDRIGKLLETSEGFSPRKAEAIRECLLTAEKYGLTNMPVREKLRMTATMVSYRMSFSEGYELYGKYIGNWGGESTKWKFEAYKDDKVVASVTKCPTSRLKLKAMPSTTELNEGDVYDMAAVRIKVVDFNNNIATYAQIPLKLKTEGPIEIVGPSIVTAEGGMCGTYIITTGDLGTAKLIIETDQTKPITVEFTVS